MSDPVRNPVVAQDVARIVSADLPWERFTGARVLVTGAAGFLPAYMVETLLHLNETRDMAVTVVGLVRDIGRARERYAHHADRPDLELVEGDASCPAGLERCDFIVHAASQASPRYYGVDPVGTMAPNVLGTSRLLELAHDWRSQAMLFFSSGEVYGAVDPTLVPTAEDQYGLVDPVDPRSCYAESKRAGEALCVAWHAQHGVPARIVRPFHTYGPGMRLDDGRVFADFVRDVVAGEDIVLHSAGEATRAFCYIADATVGFFTVLLLGKDACPYNVGNEDAEISIAGLAQLLSESFADRGIGVRRAERDATDRYVVSHIPRNAPDTTRLRALGWAPTTGLVDGFVRTVRSFE